MATAQFLKSAVWPEDYPDSSRPEIALVGRSNAGKSTLLNAMTGGAKVAKISSTPGKTRLINFFDVGEHYRLVDLPGYGYAARQADERRLWAQMTDKYFAQRENLAGIILICDMRRQWSEDENLVEELSRSRKIPFLCCLTKIDKLSRAESLKLFNTWIKTSEHPQEIFFPVSALKNDGVRPLEDYIFKAWIKSYSPKAKQE